MHILFNGDIIANIDLRRTLGIEHYCFKPNPLADRDPISYMDE